MTTLSTVTPGGRGRRVRRPRSAKPVVAKVRTQPTETGNRVITAAMYLILVVGILAFAYAWNVIAGGAF